MAVKKQGHQPKPAPPAAGKNGLTLAELLIATAIVGIIMVGAVSVDYAIRQSQRITSKSSLLAMKMSAAMLQITRDAMKTVGDGTDIGVQYNTDAICFRQDTDNNPNSYTGDTWICYWQYPVSLDLVRCDGTTPSVPPTSFAECETGATNTNPVIALTNTPYFNVAMTGGKIDYIEITLESLADPSDGYDIITNPSYRLTSRISPPGLGR